MNKGLIKLIIIIIIALFILSAFNIRISSVLHGSILRENMGYIKSLSLSTFNFLRGLF